MDPDKAWDCDVSDIRLSLLARTRVRLTSCRLWLCTRFSAALWQVLVALVVVGLIVGVLLGQLARYQGQE